MLGLFDIIGNNIENKKINDANLINNEIFKSIVTKLDNKIITDRYNYLLTQFEELKKDNNVITEESELSISPINNSDFNKKLQIEIALDNERNNGYVGDLIIEGASALAYLDLPYISIRKNNQVVNRYNYEGNERDITGYATDMYSLNKGTEVELSIDTEYETYNITKNDFKEVPIKIEAVINGKRIKIGYVHVLSWISNPDNITQSYNIKNEDGSITHIDNAKIQIDLITQIRTNLVNKFKTNKVIKTRIIEKGIGHLSKVFKMNENNNVRTDDNHRPIVDKERTISKNFKDTPDLFVLMNNELVTSDGKGGFINLDINNYFINKYGTNTNMSKYEKEVYKNATTGNLTYDIPFSNEFEGYTFVLIPTPIKNHFKAYPTFTPLLSNIRLSSLSDTIKSDATIIDSIIDLLAIYIEKDETKLNELNKKLIDLNLPTLDLNSDATFKTYLRNFIRIKSTQNFKVSNNFLFQFDIGNGDVTFQGNKKNSKRWFNENTPNEIKIDNYKKLRGLLEKSILSIRASNLNQNKTIGVPFFNATTKEYQVITFNSHNELYSKLNKTVINGLNKNSNGQPISFEQPNIFIDFNSLEEPQATVQIKEKFVKETVNEVTVNDDFVDGADVESLNNITPTKTVAQIEEINSVTPNDINNVTLSNNIKEEVNNLKKHCK